MVSDQLRVRMEPNPYASPQTPPQPRHSGVRRMAGRIIIVLGLALLLQMLRLYFSQAVREEVKNRVVVWGCVGIMTVIGGCWLAYGSRVAAIVAAVFGALVIAGYVVIQVVAN